MCSFGVSVDAVYVGKKLIQTKGKEEIGKAIDKLFEKKPASTGEEADAPVQSKPGGNQSINNLLDSLLNKKTGQEKK